MKRTESRRTRLYFIIPICSLALAVVASTTACSGNDAKTNEDDEQATTTPTTGETAHDSDTTSARAVPKKVELTSPKALPKDERDHKGEHRWSISLGGTQRESARSVAIDKDGNIFLGGLFKGTVTIADNEMVADSHDALIVKLDPKGKPLWARHFGGPGSDMIESVAVDHEGNVIVGGGFADKLVIGEKTLRAAGADDGFIAKFSGEDSRLLWAKRLGGKSLDNVQGVAVDGAGNVFASVSFRLSLELDGKSTPTEGIDDAILVALAPDGAVRWTRRLAGPGVEYARAVTTDASGAIFWAAEFSQTAKVGDLSLESVGNRDIAVIKLDTEGTPTWATSFGGLADDSVLGIDVDDGGDIVLTGTFMETLSIGDIQLKSAGEADVFVAKLSAEGAPRWAKSFGNKTEDVGPAIAADRFGNVYAGGWFRSSVDFGGGPLKSNGEKDIYVIKLDRDGNHLWSQNFGGKQVDYVRSIAIGPNDEPTMVGTFFLTASFGGEALVADWKGEAVPTGEIFVLKLSP